jgi:hypothetical protein
MTVYAVSYDLRKPGRNYQPLWDRLREWKAVRALESFWLIEATANSAATIRDDLKKYIDANDGLLVAALSGEAAWHNLKPGSDQYLLKRFGQG